MFDHGPRTRRRKEAEPIHDQNDSPFFKKEIRGRVKSSIPLLLFYISLFSFIGEAAQFKNEATQNPGQGHGMVYHKHPP